METRANYIVVGIVTLAVLLASFGFVFWIAKFGDSGDRAQLEIRIPGSVTGLSVGSQVLFNGIKKGVVKRLTIDPTNPKTVIADVEVDSDTPITAKTEATLGFQGLTGQAYIELKGGDANAPNLLAAARASGETPHIEADPGAVNNLINQAQDIAKKADQVLNGLDGFVKDNRAPLTQTFANAQKFSDALAKNADGIDEFLASVGDLSKTLTSVSTRLESTLTTAEDLLKSVDKAKVDHILANADKVSTDLAASSGDIKKLTESIGTTVQSINAFSDKASKSLDGLDKILNAADSAKIASAISNIEETAKSAKVAMADISKTTAKIGARSDDIDQIVANTKDFTGKLSHTTELFDAVLVKVSSFLGSTDGQGPGLVAEAKSTLVAFRQVADTLNAKLGPITDGLAKFSGRGLDNVDSLVQNTQRSVSRIEDAISELQKNPQRLIFGGTGSVPVYNGRNRR
jgi:phospholipid/cholesterol/gamma-HCH transport system substrate-binding protein